MLVEDFKKGINNSLKEIQKNITKQVEGLKDLQENIAKHKCGLMDYPRRNMEDFAAVSGLNCANWAQEVSVGYTPGF